MEQLLPGVDRAATRAFFRDLHRSHADTREERFGFASDA